MLMLRIFAGTRAFCVKLAGVLLRPRPTLGCWGLYADVAGEFSLKT